jgi:hypothetical protein
MATDADILKDIRDKFKADTSAWREIREDGDKNMLVVSGDVWEAMDPAGKKARIEAKRPYLSFDELGQYTNQLVNEIRANKRAVKVTAIGYGATEDAANFTANLIRQIEYRSNAQQAYTCMFENSVQRNFGALRVLTRDVGPDTLDQEIIIEPLVNPNLVTPDGNSVKPDGSDMAHCTIHEAMSKAQFRRRFKDAEEQGFQGFEVAYPDWFKDDSVMVAEHWVKETRSRLQYLMRMLDGSERLFWADDLGRKPEKSEIARSRTFEDHAVKHYLTNGYEILDETDWPGQYIPVVLCFGKVLFLNVGGVTKRKVLSLVTLAREPAMYYAYIRSCGAEVVGSVPRASVVGYQGQFTGHEQDWQRAHYEPVAYLEVNGQTDATGQQMLPLPQRQSWDPPLQNLELVAEAARRAIQAAMGTTPLPSAAQRRNEKSGKALERIQYAEQKGSFHFHDHFNDSLARTGVIVEDLAPHVYDTMRDVTVRKPDDSTDVVRVNDPSNPQSVWLKRDGKRVGLNDVTVSVGPQADSEREAASDFADTLAQSNPQVFALLGPLIVKLKNLGPLGDEMAELLETLQPPEVRAMKQAKSQGGQADPQQAIQELAVTKAQMGQMQQALQQAKQLLDTDAAKQQSQIQIAQLKAATDSDLQLKLQAMKDATSIRVAEINAATKGYAIEAQHAAAHEQQAGAEAHELGMSAVSQQQQQDQAAQAHQQALQQGDVEHQRQMEAQQVAHQQALEQGQQGIAGQMTLAEQQAEAAKAQAASQPQGAK